MATYAISALILVLGLLVLFVLWRIRFARRLPETPRTKINGDTSRDVERAFEQLRRTLEQQPLTRSTLPHHGYPDARQWLISLQETSEEAADLLKVLRLQAAQHGLSADIVLLDSIIAYEAARKYLQTYGPVAIAQGETAPASTSEEAYPNEQEWRRRLAADRQTAIQSLRQLELQRARFGLSAPPQLLASIAAYQRAARGTEAGSNGPAAPM
jgi:hypothetical protein